MYALRAVRAYINQTLIFTNSQIIYINHYVAFPGSCRLQWRRWD